MSRDQPTYRDQGAVRGSGPMAGSYSGVDHHAHRQELWGDVREDVEENGVEPKTGNEESKIPKDKVLAIYRALQREDTSHRSVAENFGVSKYTVHNIAQGNGRFGPMVAELGMPESHRERISKSMADYDPDDIRRAYRLANGDNDLTQKEIGRMCGGMSQKNVSRIKRDIAHRHITREVEVG